MRRRHQPDQHRLSLLEVTDAKFAAAAAADLSAEVDDGDQRMEGAFLIQRLGSKFVQLATDAHWSEEFLVHRPLHKTWDSRVTIIHKAVEPEDENTQYLGELWSGHIYVCDTVGQIEPARRLGDEEQQGLLAMLDGALIVPVGRV